MKDNNKGFKYSGVEGAKRLEEIGDLKIKGLSLKDGKLLFEELKKIDLKSFDFNIIKDVNGATLLLKASNFGHLEIVKYLVENGADINVKDVWRDTALMKASKKGYFEIVEYLKEKGVNINIIQNGKFDWVDRWEKEGLKKIIKEKTFEELDSEKGTLLSVLVGISEFAEDFNTTSEEINKDIKQLVENGANINFKLENGYDVSQVFFDLNGYELKNISKKKELILKDSHIDKRRGKSIKGFLNGYFQKQNNQNKELKEELDEINEKLGEQKEKKEKIEQIKSEKKGKIKNKMWENVERFVKNANNSMLGGLQSSKKLLNYLNDGFDVNSQNEKGNTILHLAAQNTDYYLSNYIIKGTSIEINKENINGETALFKAIDGNYTKRSNIVSLFLRNGANIKHKDNYGCTPLHIAVLGSEVELLLPILLGYSWNGINEKDNDGYSPLDYVIRNENIEIADFLIKKGAKITGKTKEVIEEIKNNGMRKRMNYVLTGKWEGELSWITKETYNKFIKWFKGDSNENIKIEDNKILVKGKENIDKVTELIKEESK